MRVALDAGPLVLTSGGLQRYVSELTAALSRAFPDDEWLLASDQPFQLPPACGPNVRAGAQPSTWLEKRWWAWGAERLCRRERIAVFHGTNFAVPYRSGRPSVVTLHDLSPWMDSAWHSASDRVRSRAPRMIRHEATLILTPSEAVRKQAIAHFSLPPNRVAAVPHAASAHFRPVAPASRAPYFLFVGTLEPRKNISGLLEAWREVRHDLPADWRLLIAGRRRPDFPPFAPTPGVEYLGELPESDLPSWYSGAVAVLYPSLYEGFGLPVLEAMQCGACVITSRDPAITEVAGGAAMQTAGTAELAVAMRAAFQNPGQLASFRENALERAGSFSWERTARSTFDVYREAIARFGRF